MDKTAYETYEFLPVNNAATSADQFLVVQNDGTFILNRQMQYVTQVQDVKKEEVEPCTVYDVSSQQFYVDVDNTNELIPVTEQFILPAGDNNLYGSSYLLQPGTSTNEETMEGVVVTELKQEAIPEINGETIQSNPVNNSFTEITLNDDQYKMLEEKGWVLLKSNGKIYVLNTMGLHDITANEKLIEKLKNEIQSFTTEMDTGCPQEVLMEGPDTKIANHQNTSEFPKSTMVGSCEENVTSSPLNDTAQTGHRNASDQTVKNQTRECSLIPEPIEVTTFTNQQNNGASIKIKTKFTFKDIPDKIFLGTTANGKRLVAKVVKSRGTKRLMKRSKGNVIGTTKVVYDRLEKTNCLKFSNNTELEVQFLNLIQLALRGDPEVKSTAEDLAAAESVLTHILRVQNLKQCIMGHNLVITKVIIDQDECGKITRRTKPTFVSGIVAPTNETDGRFIHIPNLIQRLKSISEKQSKAKDNTTDSKSTTAGKPVSIFHISIWESRSINNVTRVSVTLNKQQISLDLISDLNKRHPNTIYACGTCAAIFKTEEMLKTHQENQCLESEDMLSMDTDEIDSSSKLYTVTKFGKKSIYVCSQCKAKFTRLYNCQKHVKTHSTVSNNTATIENINVEPEDKQQQKVYKCKMCPSTYHHPATLSKHIVAKHIKENYK